MVPTPQNTVIVEKSIQNHSQPMARPLTGEEVVISGMSGIYPSSDSTLEFMENLYNKVDMVTDKDPRWIFNHPEVPKHLGKVNGMGKFDAQFFRVHYKQACTMEPMSRKLLEHAYAAIYDSGVNPLQLKNKVGVFIGSTFSESEKIVIYENIQRNGFGITGCNKAMYANRISYWIDGKGPSYALDIACASSMACLEHAYRSISTGQCDAAIVGGCNLCMHPNVSLNLKRAGFLCLDGKTKCFDKHGDGYVRSDAISVLFLQRAKDAKRIYSEIYHAEGNYSLRADAEFLPLRKSKDIQEFLENFYSKINVSPNEVEYVEAHGAGIAESDGNELEAIGKVFGKEKPIKVGCVKSNMGHSEPASGVCAVTKVCLAYHKGEIPANLHYNEPLDNLFSVREGKIEALTDHAHFNRGFTALNNFSYSGANIHVLLSGIYKPKDLDRYKSSIPHIVLASGRQESCVNKILNTLKSQPVDPEQIGLLHNIHEVDIAGHLCRGFTILDTNENKETVCLSQKADYFSGMAHPVWFVYSGMGSQWAGMGADLMRIPTFAAAIQRCHNVLEPKGIDIVRILTEPDKTIYDNILNSFVGIAAVQIGLTDILKEMGIVPDNIIGHSVGELGCAYADGCFTAEEMILAAYSRGLVSIQTPFLRGSMAAVGLGYKAVLALCPPEIEVACHNSFESSTISGPEDIMKTFVAELTSRGVFAKEVPCSNIAYHSRYIADAGPGLLKYLSEVIKNPKARSEKWVSSSVPQEKWDEPAAKFSSALYHTNNLLNSVLFEETAKLIPENALLIEIAPHGLLQAILKRSHSACVNIPLTRRGHANPVQFFLESIGILYQEGINPKVASLYPKIQYPVATETPLLSHLVEWDHSEDWPQAKYNTKDRVKTAAREFVISIHDDDYKYLEGHAREEAIVFPEASLLVLIWETLAMHRGVDFRNLSVVFHGIQFHGEAVIKAEEPLRLDIMIQKGNYKFEVDHDGIKIVTGTIGEIKGENHVFRRLEEVNVKEDNVLLTSEDIYKIMQLRGYSYKDQFRSILSTNANRNKADIKWTGDWITFLDSLIQFNIFAENYDGVSTAKLIKKLTINTELQNIEADTIEVKNDIKYLPARLSSVFGITRCGGVEIDNIVFNDKPKVEYEADIIETESFIPHFLTGDVDMETVMLINLLIIADNVLDKEIKVTGIEMKSTFTVVDAIKKVADKIPTSIFDVNSIQTESVAFEDLGMISKSNVFVVGNLLQDEKKWKNLYNVLNEDTFILTLEEDTQNIHLNYEHFNVLTSMTVQRKTMMLLNKANVVQKQNVKYLPIVNDSKFSWIQRLQHELQTTERVVLVSEKQTYCGLLGFVRKLIKEYGNKVGLVLVDDYLAPEFNPEQNMFKEQLKKKLAINVLNKGQWGGYYYLPSAKSMSQMSDVSLSNTVPGDIESLTWVEAPTLPASSNLVQVCFAGPCFRDAQKAVGRGKAGDNFGMDFSGIDTKGERVMGLISGGAIANTVEANPELLWPVPDFWSLEDAATVPLPYLQAYYCLAIGHPLIKNRTIFVHGGAGAFGQAVISVALALNCTIFTTVSDIHKKKFLLRLFPKLHENHIGCSLSDNYRNMVKLNTNGKNCNFVINSLSGSLREAAMSCVGFTGIFVDVSDLDMSENKDFGMSYLCEERNYRAVNVSNVFKPENSKQRKQLQVMISNGIANGTVRPISRVIYPPTDVIKAFRLLSSSKHRGRVLIRMTDPVSLSQGLNVKPRMTYASKHTYIVVCDTNDLGIELADQLVISGARKLIIHTKPRTLGGYFYTRAAAQIFTMPACRHQRQTVPKKVSFDNSCQFLYSVRSWRMKNVSLKLSSENLQTEKGCENLISEGTKLSSVEGIFIVKSGSNREDNNLEQGEFIKKFNNTALEVANLDFVSRNICPKLSHFVVLNGSSRNYSGKYVASICEKLCRTRMEDKLPALLLSFDESDQFDVTSKIVFNSLETSLRLKYNNVVCHNVKKQRNSDFLSKIARILGLTKIDDISENFTLRDLCTNEVNIEEVRTLLKEVHKLSLQRQQVQSLSIASLKQLNDSKYQNSKFNSGLGAFYTFIDEDECMATEPMVTMPTKLSNASEKEEELDPEATYLMLVPGFEGHHQMFTPICERLKLQAIAFQLGPDMTLESIPQLAANTMKFMKNRFQLKSKFYLLGYSFGVNVALELAALMEKEGHIGKVYCLDSSPDALRVQLNAYIGNLTDAQLQNTIVKHMYSLMTGNDSNALKEDLNKLTQWTEKIEACINRLRGLVNYSHQYKRSILETAYKRIKLARDYEPSFKLESELILLKGIAHPKAESLPEDYNLSKYTRQPVTVFNLESDHALAPYDCRVSNIINRLFEPQVLEEFNKRNLCDTYLADPFKIL